MIKNRLLSGMWAFAFSLLAASTAALSQSDNATPQNRVFFSYHHFHSASEAVHMVIGVASPGRAIPGKTMVSHQVTVIGADGEVVGQFETEAPAAGYAEVTFAVSESGSSWSLFADDKLLGPVALDPEFNRASFKVEVRRSTAGRNPQTGETVQIPASKVPFFSASVFDKFDGTTKSSWSSAPLDIPNPNFVSNP